MENYSMDFSYEEAQRREEELKRLIEINLLEIQRRKEQVQELEIIQQNLKLYYSNKEEQQIYHNIGKNMQLVDIKFQENYQTDVDCKFLTWKEAKQKYPNKWVVFRNPKFKDKFHMHMIGGEFVGIADDQEEMFNLIPDEDDGHIYAPRHTWEDGAVGILKSDF